jgi:uncharacterized protein YciI
MKIFILAAAFIAAIISADNNEPKDVSLLSEHENKKTEEMKQYWMIMLYKGPNRNQSQKDAAIIQEKHIANIERLAASGTIIMAGPMGYDKDLRGIFIMDGKDSATIAEQVKTDTAIITGRLRFEVHPWWVQKGKYELK